MDAVNGLTSGAGGLGSLAEGAGKTRLSNQEFFQIMITELTNQDPLEPLDNQEFLGQITQMQTLETMTRLSEGIQSLLVGQQLTSAGALIGKSVAGVDVQGAAIEGIVESVAVEGDEVRLNVGGRSLELSQIRVIGAAEYSA